MHKTCTQLPIRLGIPELASVRVATKPGATTSPFHVKLEEIIIFIGVLAQMDGLELRSQITPSIIVLPDATGPSTTSSPKPLGMSAGNTMAVPSLTVELILLEQLVTNYRELFLYYVMRVQSTSTPADETRTARQK